MTKGRHKSDSKGDDERQWDEEADKTVHIEDDQVEPSLATVQLTKSQVTNKKATKISKKMQQTRDFTLVLLCPFRREATPTDNLIRLLYDISVHHWTSSLILPEQKERVNRGHAIHDRLKPNAQLAGHDLRENIHVVEVEGLARTKTVAKENPGHADEPHTVQAGQRIWTLNDKQVK